MSIRTHQIRDALLVNIAQYAIADVGKVASRFGVTRPAVYRQLASLADQGLVRKIKRPNHPGGDQFELKYIGAEVREFALKEISEEQVWAEISRDLLSDLGREERKICQHGTTEMVNNAIDHSEGKNVSVEVFKSIKTIEIIVRDDGIGIFEKIQNALNLSEPRHSILELSKGKLTTDPSRHSGEGIFFTSRMFDIFAIESEKLKFIHSTGAGDRRDDWAIEQINSNGKGTLVYMQLLLPAPRTVEEVFNVHHAELDDDYHFSRTHVPVRLAQVGQDFLVSRSQAKRILARFDRFAEVMLDFEGVETVGQAFTDEIFRVFQKQHPSIKITYINARPQVKRMILKATAAYNAEKEVLPRALRLPESDIDEQLD